MTHAHAWILLAAACLPQESVRGFRRAAVALEGPLEAALLHESSGTSTRIECALGPGAHLVLPAPVSAAAPELVLRAATESVPPGGHVEVRSVEGEHWDDPWLARAPGLRLRSRPPVNGLARTPDLATGSLLLATLLAVAGSRKRALLALGIGLAGAALLLSLPRRAGAPRIACVLEGEASTASWLCVQARADELELPIGGPLCLEVDPTRAALAFRVEHHPSGADRWFASSGGARLVRIDALRTPAGRLDPAANSLLELESCWVRGADGAWTERGPWRRGEALPEPRGTSSPPGWLASLLPQGVGILIGRVAAGAFDASAWDLALPAPTDAPWVRLSGF